MAKIRKISDIQQEIAFTDFDFYQRNVDSFKTSVLGRIKSLLPLWAMSISFRLIEERPKSIRAKRWRKSFFTPEVKVAMAFLKMYTGLSAQKQMEALNGNIHYQIFCGVWISPDPSQESIAEKTGEKSEKKMNRLYFADERRFICQWKAIHPHMKRLSFFPSCRPNVRTCPTHRLPEKSKITKSIKYF